MTKLIWKKYFNILQILYVIRQMKLNMMIKYGREILQGVKHKADRTGEMCFSSRVPTLRSSCNIVLVFASFCSVTYTDNVCEIKFQVKKNTSKSCFVLNVLMLGPMIAD